MATIYIHPGEKLVIIASVGSKIGELDIEVADLDRRAIITWKNATLQEILEAESDGG